MMLTIIVLTYIGIIITGIALIAYDDMIGSGGMVW